MGIERKDAHGGLLCSEMLDLHLQSSSGRERELKANLEEIWQSGALFQTNVRIPLSTSLWFSGGGSEFRGQVTARTLVKELGYFIEVKFEPGCVWSQRKYRPKHSFNPRGFNPLVQLANKIFEATPHRATFARTAGQ